MSDEQQRQHEENQRKHQEELRREAAALAEIQRKANENK